MIHKNVLIMLQKLLYYIIWCDVKLFLKLNCCNAKVRLQGKHKDFCDALIRNRFVFDVGIRLNHLMITCG